MLSNFLILGLNMVSLLACFIFEMVFSICLLYPLRMKCFVSFLLYFLHMAGEVVLRITLVISPIAIPLRMCDGM